jgi:hypothetical protein
VEPDSPEPKRNVALRFAWLICALRSDVAGSALFT